MNNTKPEILFEDDDILGINKPAGVVVNTADTARGTSLQAWMAARLAQQPIPPEKTWKKMIPEDFNPEFGSPEEIFAERQGLVHRLDKDTSGVMVWAKNPGALIGLLAQFKNRQTTKKYLALVHGKFAVPEATLNMPLGRASYDRKVFAVRPDGREAVTQYQVLQSYKELLPDKVKAFQPEISNQVLRRFSIYQGFSLLACWPKTGRTHQIRVHLAHIQHPLVGDITYVGKKRKALDPLWCPRQFLHAESLTFRHPQTSKSMTLTAPLSPDLQLALDCLAKD